MNRSLVYFRSHRFVSIGSKGRLSNETTSKLSQYGGFTKEFFYNIIERRSYFIRFLGLKVDEILFGKLRVHLPLRSELAGSRPIRPNIETKGVDAGPCLHHGVIAALIDHTGGFGSWSVLAKKSQFIATIDLRVDFFEDVPMITGEDRILCEAEAVDIGDKFVRTDVVCWNADKTRKIAVGRGLYNIYVSPFMKNESSPLWAIYNRISAAFPHQLQKVVKLFENISYLRLTYLPRRASKKVPKSREHHIAHHRSALTDRHHAPSFGVWDGASQEDFTDAVVGKNAFVKNVLAMRVVDLKPGDVTLLMPFSDVLIGNIFIPCLHGGVTIAALEHTGLACAKSVMERDSHGQLSTVNVTISYLKPAPCVDMLCDAVVVNRSGSMILTSIVCWNHRRTVKVATGTALFRINQAGTKSEPK